MDSLQKTVERKSRKFKEFSTYAAADDNKYHLLPFRFHRINDDKEVLVNETGDFLVVPRGTAHRVIMRDISSLADADLFGDLLANFFITEEAVPPLLDILAVKYRTKKSFLHDFTSLHIFVITLRCEHTCHYCQVSRVSQDKLSFDMQYEHIDRGIEMMMRSPNPYVTMEFQGGEALLAFESIVYAVEKAKKQATLYNKQVTFVICTNLAPITVEMLLFCKENNILISTSLDGPAFIHNQNRHRPGKDSYDFSINGINKCREFLGEDRVSALLTTTNLSLQYPDEIVDEYYRQGFKSIFLRPISPYGFATKNERKNYYAIDDFLVFYKRALHKILSYNLNGSFFREDYAAIILKKILTPFPVGYVDLQSPAGMINSVIVFNYDGNVYASDEARMLAEMKDDTFKLGSLDTHSYEDIFYGEKAETLATSWTNESLPGCSECAFQSYCGADPVHNYATQGNLVGHRPSSSFCGKNMEIIRYLFELMEDKAINKIFRSWVN